MTKTRPTFADLRDAQTARLATKLITDATADAALVDEATRHLMLMTSGHELHLDDTRNIPPELMRIMRALLVGPPELRAYMMATCLAALESYPGESSP